MLEANAIEQNIILCRVGYTKALSVRVRVTLWKALRTEKL